MCRSLVFLCCVGAFSYSLSAQVVERNLFAIQKEMDAFYSIPANRANGYKQWKRTEYYFEPRVDRQGNIVDVAKRKEIELKKYRSPHTHSQQRAYSGGWSFYGPSYFESGTGIGRINRIDFHPTDENSIYVATAGGGLWHTSDHGASWTPLTESLPVNNLSGVAIDYSNPNVIYILTGDGDGCCGSARRYSLGKTSIGVLKSTNGGQTWKPTGLSFEEQDVIWPFDLKMHPTIPEILFACTADGIYRSLNSADDWTKILDEKIYEIEFKVDDPSTIFAVGEESFYRSTSLGVSWNDTVPIPDLNGDVGRMSLATCPSNANAVYIVASPDLDTLYRGLYFSNDAGLSFSFVSDTPNIVTEQAWYDLTMVCNPNDATEILVGAVTIWSSVASGDNFVEVGGTHVDIHELRTNPLNDILYAATDGGLYFSEDFGDDWTYISDFLEITQYYKIAVSQQNPFLVIAGSQDNGTHRNNDLDIFGMDRIYGKDGMDCVIHPLNDSLMIYSAQNGEFVISRDGGENSDSLINVTSLDSSVRSIWVTPVAWDPNDTNRIFIGFDPIYRSVDGGDGFSPIPDTVSGRRVLHIAPEDSQRMYAGDRYTASDGSLPFHLWTSSDGGDSWIRLDTSSTFPDTLLIVSGLTTNPNNASEVWITLSGWEQGQKVYRSLDAGTTWNNMSGTLPNLPVLTIAFQNTGSSDSYAVYIGNDIGVFYRDDNLGDWTPFSNNLPMVEVSDLKICDSFDLLLAGTYGRGIWFADLFSACEDEMTITESEQQPGYSYFFQASDSISSSLIVDDGFGISVIYQAGHAVSLQQGFHATARNRAVFQAKAAPCSGGVPQLLTTPESDLPPTSKFEINIAPLSRETHHKPD